MVSSEDPSSTSGPGAPRRHPRIPPVNVHDGAFDPAREHTVIFQPSGRRGTIPEGATLLEAARRLGVGIESICGGRQTCSKCYVRIEAGSFGRYGIESTEAHLTPIGERELYYREKRGLPEGIRYSCDACVLGDVLVTVPEESQAHKQIIRKSATERAIEINPGVRKYYVEIPEPHLGQSSADADSVMAELAARFPELHDLTFDYPALRDLQFALRAGNWGITVSVWNEREIVRVEPGYREVAVGLAVDIGTTSVAAYLCDLRTGRVLATEAMMNPQVSYGDDIMSRISYTMEEDGGLDRLHTVIIAGLNDLAARAAARAGIEASEIIDAVFVGNSTMHHILLGFHPRYLGLAPFVPAVFSPVDFRARDLGLHALNPGAWVHVLPLEAGFVGADNMGVVLAEEPHEQDEIVLIIDVGTNGEILLGNRERLLCASSPTGPALEGAQILFGMRAAPGAIERVRVDPATLEARFKVIGEDRWSDELPPEQLGARGICGSGIIEAIAELWKAGIVDDSGRWTSSLVHPRLIEHDGLPAYVLAWPGQTALGDAILVSIADVRAIQLAKAALYTGVRILMGYRGVAAVGRIILAGAFGSYIDPERAMTIGLIPDCDLGQVYAVGNAAGDGARIALLNKARRVEAARVARWVEHITMPLEGDFQEIFMNALAFPNAADPFPHLEPILAEAARRRSTRERSAVTA
ncbi:MAG: ASKHA domain-containing protein [Ardenticatenaceae bacterium]|nr:ASKHA domain-containing protein [Ardenticatenaceae bacterium]HBY94965.1 ferredoxin [Chloroflexota bacterium]